jgi:hypothetical protein
MTVLVAGATARDSAGGLCHAGLVGSRGVMSSSSIAVAGLPGLFGGDRVHFFPVPNCNRMRGRHTGGYLVG